jgi:hypothetical protein
MHMSHLLRRAVLALGLAAVVLPLGAEAQLRTIVAKSVSASSSAATLELQFENEGSLEISFTDGTILLDRTEIGSYEPGDELDTAWRSLLGEAMVLENGALAEMLDDWTTPTGLGQALADAAGAVHEAIDAALTDVDIQVEGDGGTVSISIGDERSLIELLVNSVGQLGVLEDALSGLDDDVRVHVDEDVVIPEGSVFDGTLVVIGGTLRIEGGVGGDVVIVGGALDVRGDGYIAGEARIADSRILRSNGDIRGGVVDVLEDERASEQEAQGLLRDQIRREMREDLRREIRNAARLEDESFSILAPLRPVVRGVGGIMEKLIAVFLLGLLGAGFLAFAGDNVDAISETARRSPGRAAMVGVAGTFLLIPVWLLGAVALAVSIIGIPVAIAWLPLFPLAAVFAALLGYVAVARNAGEWMADSGYPLTGWIRKSNSIFTLFGGLLALSTLLIAGHLVSIAPFLGMLSGLLFIVGGIVTFLAMQIGFGAVLLTRAGRKREYDRSYDADLAWEEAVNVDLDGDAPEDGAGSKGENNDDA